MSDRERLENLLDRIVECEGSRRSAMTDGDGDAATEWAARRDLARAQALGLLAPEPPQPAGPVTSEEAVLAELAEAHRRDPRRWLSPGEYSPSDLETCRYSVDAAMPLLARDHGYVKAGAASPASEASLTPAEVERRAREFFDAEQVSTAASFYRRMVAALTRADK